MRLSLIFAVSAALLSGAAPAWSQAAESDSLLGGPGLGGPELGGPGLTGPVLAGAGLAGSGVIRVDLAGRGGAGQAIAIPRGKSATVALPVDVRDVMVTDPKVADVVIRTARQISVLGVGSGQTDAVFFDAAGRRILALNIRVDQDYSVITDTINRLVPGSTVHVEGLNNSVVLSGMVASLADSDKAVQIAQQFLDPNKASAKVVNMLSIAGKQQVMLKVRIIEVQRTVIKQLGFNLGATLGQLGMPQYALATAASFAVNGGLQGGLNGSGYSLNTTTEPTLSGFQCLSGAYTCTNVVRSNSAGVSNAGAATVTSGLAGKPGLNQANATIDAFEQVGLVRTLAEPSLTTVSGEAAKFLAGGEFPVPVSQALGVISVQFETYGVGLGFTPVVLSNGRISLKISSEVSELTNQGAVNITTAASGSTPASTLTIPGLKVRRADTTVELPSGGAMMIAGLLQEETQEDIASLPGLMNLPVLGALFNSRDYQAGQTEMVVIVTPYLVSPTSPDKLQTPADGLRIASDPETILLGRLNKVYKAPPTADAAANNYQGPAGYVIE